MGGDATDKNKSETNWPISLNEPELVVSNNSIIKRIGCGYSHVYFLSSEPVQKYLLINSEIQNKAAKYETSKDYTDDRDASN